MNLQIDETTRDTTLILSLKGRIDGLGAGQLERHMNDAFGRMTASFKAVKLVVFDMAGVGYVASAGLRVFVLAARHMSQKGGELRLQNVTKPVMEVLAMSGLAKTLKVQPLPDAPPAENAGER